MGEGVLLGQLPPPLPNTHSFRSETTSFLGKLTGALGADSTPPHAPITIPESTILLRGQICSGVIPWVLRLRRPG